MEKVGVLFICMGSRQTARNGAGRFDYGVFCGSRCLNSSATPWNADGIVGLRCVCDAL